jgi:hypothetical protein
LKRSPKSAKHGGLTWLTECLDYSVPRKKNRSTAPGFPVSPDNPFGIDLSPERVEPFVARETASASRHPVESELPLELAWSDPARGIWLYHADCLAVLDRIAKRYPDGIFDMIFADPPYFLSNGGVTCHAGRMVSVNKGDWDKSKGPEEDCDVSKLA